MTMKRPLSNVSCKYGAPMGRSNTIPTNIKSAKLYLEKLKWVDGDYDQGGAYWGGGMGDTIYRAYEDDIEIFVRAKSRVEAKAVVKEDLEAVIEGFEGVTFYK